MEGGGHSEILYNMLLYYSGQTTLPEIPLVRYMADMTPTEKAMLTDRNWPLACLLVVTCAAAEQPKSFVRGGQRG